jgi:hypothetical protein
MEQKAKLHPQKCQLEGLDPSFFMLLILMHFCGSSIFFDLTSQTRLEMGAMKCGTKSGDEGIEL